MEPIFTIGHSTHEADAFLRLLRRRGILGLADVRRFPSSRRMPRFNAAALEHALAAKGIAYVHLPELGGRRDPRPGSPHTGWRVGQFRGYADHMETEDFRAGLERVRELARERRTAVMCAEAQWWRCHRRLLSDALLVPGLAVWHIDARGGVERHELTPFAVVEGERLVYPA
jgi:uncharacterized protein (DUF488 family)